MLDTRFPRIRGDIGNPSSFPFPVERRIIPNAVPEKVVRQSPDALLPLFVDAAQHLEEEGAKLITTSCGFLTPFQHALAAAVSIPVITSSLFMYPEIEKGLPQGKRPGILTISGSSLTTRHLAAAGIPENAAIASTEGGSEFTRAILENHDHLDVEKAEADNVSAALHLIATHEDVGAILLECTNMPPYGEAITRTTGLPVYSILDAVNALWAKTS